MENNEPLIPTNYPESQRSATETAPSGVLSGSPSPKAQSWGAVISIIIIVLMIVIGAFYAWGNRISQEKALQAAPTSE